MKIENRVHKLESDINRNNTWMLVEFNLNLELYGESSLGSRTIYVKFNNKGQIIDFPDLKINIDGNPSRYIMISEIVKDILSYQGERAVRAYEEAEKIYDDYQSLKQKICDEANYNEIINKRFSKKTLACEMLQRMLMEENPVLKATIESDLAVLNQDILNDEETRKKAELEMQNLEIAFMNCLSTLEL